MKMTERYVGGPGASGPGSTRKHKKHKLTGPSSKMNHDGETVVNDAITTTTTTTNGQISMADGGGCTKPLKLVLKVGQSGAYSPADTTGTYRRHHNNNTGSQNDSDDDNDDDDEEEEEDMSCESNRQRRRVLPNDANNNSNTLLRQGPLEPPQLLPLTVDSYHHNVDLQQINHTLMNSKKSKKKKKKHHHHHHHHHHHGHGHHSHHHHHHHGRQTYSSDEPDASASTTKTDSSQPTVVNKAPQPPSTTVNSTSNNDESAAHDAMDVAEQPPPPEQRTATTAGPSENLEEDMMNPDSIFSSVDLIDIDSCSKLDISALVPGDDDEELNEHEDDSSRHSAASLSSISNYYQLSQRPRAKLRPTSSVYRQLLQKGQVRCDSNNLYEHIRRRPKTSAASKNSGQFQAFLLSLLSKLEEKDPCQLFAWPVIDRLMPGYSQVVKHPMDFHTIRKKIEHDLYRSVAEMKYDVRLLCENAIRYYRHSGLHYREASHLWYHAKTRVFARDQLAEHVKQFPPLTMPDLGMDDLSKSATPVNGGKSQTTTANGTSTLQSLLDDTSSCQAEPSAQNSLDALSPAAGQLMARTTADEKLPLLSSRQLPEDGSTTLPFVLPPDDDANTARLGQFVGRLREGTSALPPYPGPAEWERVRPCRYVDEMPFGSHLPHLDSGTATITHDETALLFDTFHRYQNSQHSSEIERVANDTHYLNTSYVDSLLRIVSNGQFEPSESTTRACSPRPVSPDVGDDHDNHVDDDSPLGRRLCRTGQLLDRLRSLQWQRLASGPEPVPPSDREYQTAGEVTGSLTEIIREWFQPRHLVEPETIHRQLGIKLPSPPSPDHRN